MADNPPAETRCEVERRLDGFEPICHAHDRAIGTCLRALEAERDGLKHLLAEAVECLKAIDPLLLNDPDFQDLRRRAERALGGGK